MNPLIRPIETEYRGFTFRSRLEAKWAAMFDLLDWPWDYEPIDLKGYIPDFGLQFKLPVLAEVKPAMSIEDCKEHVPKIERSGWEGDVVIFGGALNLGSDPKVIECCYYGQWILDGKIRDWQPGEMHRCLKCGKYSIHHTAQSYRCIVGGCYDGKRFLGPVNRASVKKLWASATNTVRFNP